MTYLDSPYLFSPHFSPLLFEFVASIPLNPWVRNESRRTGSRWASDTSKQLWLLTFSIWEHRCSNLHDSPTILNVHGLPYLQTRIAYEYTLGYSDLPSSYKPYFRDSLSVLLKKHPPHLKRWFLLIRSIREALSPHLVMDRFFDDKALRRWVGLPIK